MEPLPRGAGWISTRIDRESGSRHVFQRVIHLRRGRTPALSTGPAEEVLYVAEGRVRLESDPHIVEAGRGTGLLVGDAHRYLLINEGPNDAVVVAVRPPSREGYVVGHRSMTPIPTLHEDDQESLPAGDDRFFKLMIQSEHFTQFVGFIKTSRAPFHTHTYEEAIYILEGEGTVHIEDRHLPITKGSSIFLPPGTPHCLENAGPSTLKLLGVFSPPGSPAARMDPPSP